MIMASGVKVLYLLVIWISCFTTLTLFNIAGGVIFPTLFGLLSMTGSNPAVDPSQLGFLPSLFNVIMIIVLVIVTYKIYQEFIAGDDTYYPGY